MRLLPLVGLYALAMAYVESSVVVYLRDLYDIDDIVRDLPTTTDRLTAIEIGREAATIAKTFGSELILLHAIPEAMEHSPDFDTVASKIGDLFEDLAKKGELLGVAVSHQFEIRHEVIEVRYRHRLARALTLLWSAWRPCRAGAVRCLQWALTPDTAAALLKRHADLIVSCGASTAPVNLLWAAENGAKSIVV
ncbi:MAG: hypothetical protein IIC89_04330, partial [Chloroflexi bacterium]|nr:hypothetical protein [Chloroflexota bacterium]